MARGFESKDIEFQQAEAARDKSQRRLLSMEERELESRRRTVELSLARMRADLAATRALHRRRAIELAIATLEGELAVFSQP